MTKAQRKKISIGMKAAFAKKKYNKDQGQIGFPPVPEKIEGASYSEVTMKPLSQLEQAQDKHRLAEFNYRRGLVAAMECILRELR